MPISRRAFSSESLAWAALTMMVWPNSRRIEPGGALEGSVGPSTSRIFADGFDPLIDDRDALFGSGFLHQRRVAFAWGAAGHEADDILKLAIAVKGAEGFAKFRLNLR